MSILDNVKAKMQSLETQLNEQLAAFKQKEEHIAQLMTDKNTIASLIHQIRGAVSMGESIVTDVAKVVGDVVSGDVVGAIEDGVKAVEHVVSDVNDIIESN